MKRTQPLMIGALVAAISAAAAVGALASAPTAQTARIAKVQLRTTSLGRILVNGAGFTIYEFTSDRLNKDTCVRHAGCPGTWPALTTTGKPKAGPGVKVRELGTITLPGGVKQVTYFGHPLYSYEFDVARGDTGYVGAVEFGGAWEAVNAAGHGVK